jgi:rhodanese-related sulfurtransferase
MLLIFASCSAAGTTEKATNDSAEKTGNEPVVKVITAREAKEMMDTLEEFTIVDVREQYEYDAGYIDGAVLVSLGSIEDLAPELLPDKNEILFIYCRSGRRSAEAAGKLRELGYLNIYDFGGIIDWPYETVTAG